MKLKEIASLVKGHLTGNDGVEITGVSSLEDAQRGEITFLEKSKQLSHLQKIKASAVILSEDLSESFKSLYSSNQINSKGISLLWVQNSRLAFTQVMELFRKEEDFGKGIHPTVILGKGNRIDPSAVIAPYAVLGENVEIGSGTLIGSFAYIGSDVRIGSNCLIYPHVSLMKGVEIGKRCIIHPGAVIGSDGFGFIPDGAAHRKVPQLGNVVLEDDVEIGANVTIDRATLGTTRIGKGAKFDDLVHIAHNVEIGEGSLLAAQVGIAGSTKIGKKVIFGGQAGLVDHLDIGDEVHIGAQAGVIKSFPPKTVISGYPARPHAQAMRVYAAMQKLPELIKKIEKLLKKP
jgi:UDP-3-O-[3-hydroxymyristoyl] glucosamine N-acyltransferase